MMRDELSEHVNIWDRYINSLSFACSDIIYLILGLHVIIPGNVLFETVKLMDGIIHYPPPFLIIFIKQPLIVIIN